MLDSEFFLFMLPHTFTLTIDRLAYGPAALADHSLAAGVALPSPHSPARRGQRPARLLPCQLARAGGNRVVPHRGRKRGRLPARRAGVARLPAHPGTPGGTGHRRPHG